MFLFKINCANQTLFINMFSSQTHSAGVDAYKAPEVAEGQGKTNLKVKITFNTVKNMMKRVIYFHMDV